MRILVIDSSIRENSKTRMVLNRFLAEMNNNRDIEIDTIYLNNNPYLMPLNDCLLAKRDSDCYNKRFYDDYYCFAKKLKSCDALVIAAPFYDLCFPTILKCFIEQTLVYNLTFVDDEFGVKGIINCKKLIYLSVRGGVINDYNNVDIATPYLNGYKNMLGIKEFYTLSYSCIDYPELEKKLEEDIPLFYKKCLYEYNADNWLKM